jgi:hypothetical protein
MTARRSPLEIALNARFRLSAPSDGQLESRCRQQEETMIDDTKHSEA